MPSVNFDIHGNYKNQTQTFTCGDLKAKAHQVDQKNNQHKICNIRYTKYTRYRQLASRCSVWRLDFYPMHILWTCREREHPGLCCDCWQVSIVEYLCQKLPLACPLQGIALFLLQAVHVFLVIDVFTSLPLHSEVLTNAHTIVEISRSISAFQTACPWIGTVSQTCDQFTTLSRLSLYEIECCVQTTEAVQH